MKSNRCFFEQLEGRQLLSAAPTLAPLVFQGTAVNSSGIVVDKLQMTVQKTATGYSDKLIVTNNTGEVTVLTFSGNATGQFSDTQGYTAFAGRMNTADTAITGTWALNGPHGDTHGSLTLNEVPPAETTPPTTNKTTTVTDYVGTFTNSSGQTSKITIQVIDTNGILTGLVYVHNYNNQLVPILFSISKTGAASFTFTLAGQTNIVQGQFSSNGKTVTAKVTSINSDGTVGFDTLTATAA